MSPPSTPDAPTAPGRGALLLQLGAGAAWLALLVSQERRLLGDALPAESVPLVRSLAVPLAAIGLALWLPRRARWCWLAFFGAFASSVLVFDKGSMPYFDQPVGIEMAVAIHQLWDARESTAALVSGTDWLYAGSFLGFLWFARGPGHTRRGAWIARALGTALVAALLPTLAVTWRDLPAPNNAEELQRPAMRLVRSHGLGLYHVWDGFDALKRRMRSGRIGAVQARLIRANFARKHELNALGSPLFGIARGRNVIIVQLEAFQAFVRDLDVQGGTVTPVLDRLAREGLAPERCVDITRVGRTSDAEFAVLASLLPHSRSPVSMSHVGNRWVTLPKQLAAAGYDTVSLHAFKRPFWNRAVAHPSYGIDEMLFQDAFEPGRNLAWGLADEGFFEQLPALLAARPEPFFAFAISLSSHHPFRIVPSELADWPTGMPDDSMASSYLRLVHYTDAAVQRLLDGLRDRGLLERSLLVFYGDHVAGLDPQARGHVLQLAQHDLARPAERSVPLVISIPGLEDELAPYRAALAERVVSMHDIAPTVLHLLGQPTPSGFDGTHLFVDDVQRDVVPIAGTSGFVRQGRVVSPLDAGESDSVERNERTARVAAARLRMANDIIESDAQRLPPGDDTPTAQTAVQELLLRAYPVRPQTALPPWTVLTTDARPLPTGRLLVPSIPPLATGISLTVRIDNPDASAAAYTLRGLTVDGQPAWEQTATTPAGEHDEVVLYAEQTGATGVLSHAVLQLSGALTARASLVLQGALRSELPLLDSTSARTEIRGPTAGLASAAVIVINAGSDSARVAIESRVGGNAPQRRDVVVAPGAAHIEAIHIPAGDDQIAIIVTGDEVSVSHVRWDRQGQVYR